MKTIQSRNPIISALGILILISSLGCGEEEEFPYNQLVGRWKVLTIGGRSPSHFFSPVIEGRYRVNINMAVTSVKWEYIFEADSTWSSVIHVHGDVLRFSGLTFFDETIKFSGIYTVDEYDSDEHSWYVTLTGTNVYSSSDLIKTSDILPYMPFPVMSTFSGRFWARLPSIRSKPRMLISRVSLSRED